MLAAARSSVGRCINVKRNNNPLPAPFPTLRSRCGLTDLCEDDFAGLRSLRHLDISHNRLRSLPAWLRLVTTALETIDAVGNRIFAVAPELLVDSPTSRPYAVTRGPGLKSSVVVDHLWRCAVVSRINCV